MWGMGGSLPGFSQARLGGERWWPALPSVHMWHACSFHVEVGSDHLQAALCPPPTLRHMAHLAALAAAGTRAVLTSPQQPACAGAITLAVAATVASGYSGLGTVLSFELHIHSCCICSSYLQEACVFA